MKSRMLLAIMIVAFILVICLGGYFLFTTNMVNETTLPTDEQASPTPTPIDVIPIDATPINATPTPVIIN